MAAAAGVGVFFFHIAIGAVANAQADPVRVPHELQASFDNRKLIVREWNRAISKIHAKQVAAGQPALYRRPDRLANAAHPILRILWTPHPNEHAAARIVQFRWFATRVAEEVRQRGLRESEKHKQRKLHERRIKEKKGKRAEAAAGRGPASHERSRSASPVSSSDEVDAERI